MVTTTGSYVLNSDGVVGERDLPRLAFDSTVSRELVHRQSISEVFLTDCLAGVTGDRFLVGAQWPRRHGFYRTHSGRYDTILLAETLRQAAIYLAHTHYDVPLNDQFIMQSMSIDADLSQLFIGEVAAQVSIEVLVPEVQRRDGRVRGLSVELDFCISGVRIGSGRGSTLVVTAETYDRIRWGKQGRGPLGATAVCEPLAAASVGIRGDEDVVLGAAGQNHGWRVRTDTTHPVLFEHACDHMPGMLMIEAMRQAVRVELGRPELDLQALDIAFHKFVELDHPADVIVTMGADSGTTVIVEVVQGGEVMGTATIVVEAALPQSVPQPQSVG